MLRHRGISATSVVSLWNQHRETYRGPGLSVSVPAITVTVIEAPSLGESRLRVSRAILERGAPAAYDGQPIKELALPTLSVERPDPEDAIVAELGDPERLAGMHENFFVQKQVRELGDAPSYAVRLFNYAGAGRDQIGWVVDRLRADPECRSATSTRNLKAKPLLQAASPGGPP